MELGDWWYHHLMSFMQRQHGSCYHDAKAPTSLDLHSSHAVFEGDRALAILLCWFMVDSEIGRIEDGSVVRRTDPSTRNTSLLGGEDNESGCVGGMSRSRRLPSIQLLVFQPFLPILALTSRKREERASASGKHKMSPTSLHKPHLRPYLPTTSSAHKQEPRGHGRSNR